MIPSMILSTSMAITISLLITTAWINVEIPTTTTQESAPPAMIHAMAVLPLPQIAHHAWMDSSMIAPKQLINVFPCALMDTMETKPPIFAKLAQANARPVKEPPFFAPVAKTEPTCITASAKQSAQKATKTRQSINVPIVISAVMVASPLPLSVKPVQMAIMFQVMSVSLTARAELHLTP